MTRLQRVLLNPIDAPQTQLKALATLESAVLECKKRDINTPEVKDALDSLERHIWPKWLIPQFRYHLENEEPLENREGQEQVLRATFPGIRNCVRELIRVQMDTLAVKFHETKDMAVHDEIDRLAGELGKLDEPWVFTPITKD